jgi:hypothetical protein
MPAKRYKVTLEPDERGDLEKLISRGCQWRMKFRQHGRSKIPQFGRAVISRQGDRNSCLWAGDRGAGRKAAGVRAV